MAKEQIKQLLFRLGQQALLQKVDTVSDDVCYRLEQNIREFDMQTLDQMLLPKKEKTTQTTFFPYAKYITQEAITDFSPAIELLQKQKVATIVLAGGEGSRFGANRPKGLYPLSIIKQKSLLQLLAEKTVASAQCTGAMPYLAIMTSPTTQDETVRFFQEHDNFSIDPEHIDFFTQTSLPVTDTQGNFLVNEEGALLMAPDGNGNVFSHLEQSGILAKWQALGIEYVTVMIVDNALADPYPLPMLTAHVKNGADVTCGAVLRADPDEKVGVFVKKAKGIGVIEYSEMLSSDLEAQDIRGNFQYPLANISYFVFSCALVETLACLPDGELPLHKAQKNLTDAQKTFLGKNAVDELTKYEYFIFDVLEYATKPQVLLLNRREYFSPLKNLKGPDGVTSVQKALLQRDHMQYEKVAKVEIFPDRLFELDMAFYYPTQEILERWHKRALPKVSYIEHTME